MNKQTYTIKELEWEGEDAPTADSFCGLRYVTSKLSTEPEERWVVSLVDGPCVEYSYEGWSLAMVQGRANAHHRERILGWLKEAT